ncbi:DUF3108 domain-containing protein [Undibacterium seohonense]|uniref:DUF3108 domain-containing protein n=1 Tax=Undibacterium seohonense TaxID=1344950 RepID=A0ABR6X2W6_9BURK|nr:DUF3108 domain-containing protein [Undibacterium seohonense]MBC3807147.1 DUF3108 domain-containing protein [Undibacterium seohonense]
MSQHFFSSQLRQQLSKLSTWLFLLTTILLHIVLLESAGLKEWTPKPTLEDLPNITVSLRPSTEALPPTEDKAKLSPKQSTPIAKAPRPQATKAAQIETKTEDLAIPASESAVKETSEVVEPKPTEIQAPIDEKSAEALPEFSLRVPESAEMQMEITHTKVNGNPTTGVGSLSWERANGKYRLSIEAGINLLITNLNLLTITSEGHIDLFGLTPVISNDIRRTRPATAIHFNHTEKTISFSASNKIVAMENGAQDAVSVLLQLAAIGNAKEPQLTAGKELTIQVAEGRDATPFLFRVIGEEEIDSKLAAETGKLMTVHVSRPPKPGFYNSQLDIWFAPSLGWYPVQIRNTESNGSVTNQVVVALKQKINREN